MMEEIVSLWEVMGKRKIKRKEIKLAENVLYRLSENLYVRKTEDGKIEIYEVVGEGEDVCIVPLECLKREPMRFQP
jgi:hypothetical protein